MYTFITNFRRWLLYLVTYISMFFLRADRLHRNFVHFLINLHWILFQIDTENKVELEKWADSYSQILKSKLLSILQRMCCLSPAWKQHNQQRNNLVNISSSKRFFTLFPSHQHCPTAWTVVNSEYYFFIGMVEVEVSLAWDGKWKMWTA